MYEKNSWWKYRGEHCDLAIIGRALKEGVLMLVPNVRAYQRSGLATSRRRPRKYVNRTYII
ncbi:hypothetical protein BH10ACI3_BH10ACI3_26910 [soil metagenome]